MVLEHPNIISSTFKNEMLNSNDTFWNLEFDESISPIVKSFDPNEIKKVVEYLVMSRYGCVFCNNRSKKSSRNKNLSSTFSHNSKNNSNCSSFDEAKFLRTALGDAVDSKKIFPFLLRRSSDDMTVNSSNLSELISNYTKYTAPKSLCASHNYVNKFYNNNNNDFKSISSIGDQSNPSQFNSSDDTLNRNNSETATISQENSIYESLNTIPECKEDSSLEELYQELFLTNQNKEQLLKAVNSDSISHKKGYSRERLEAEKLLLITDIKNRFLIEEIDQLSSSLSNSNNLRTGSVKISNIHMRPCKSENFDEFFVCLLICGSKVQTSEICKIKSNGIVTFKDILKIDQLPASFKTYIKIFSIPAKKVKKFNNLLCVQHEREIPKNSNVVSRSSLFRLCEEIEFYICDRSFAATSDRKRISVCVSVRANLNFQLKWES